MCAAEQERQAVLQSRCMQSWARHLLKKSLLLLLVLVVPWQVMVKDLVKTVGVQESAVLESEGGQIHSSCVRHFVFLPLVAAAAGY